MSEAPSVAERFDRAVAAHRDGRLDDAEAGYLEILKSEPDHPGALSNLGRIARSRGDLGAAIDFYRRSAAHAAAAAETHFNLGNALAAAGALDDAAAAYERAIEIAPSLTAAADALARVTASVGDTNALTRQANDLFLKGEGDAAAALLQRAVRLRPGDPATLQNLGFLYRSTGHYRKALAVYRRAAAQDDAEIIHVEIANCLINIGKPIEAREVLSKRLLTPQGRRAAASSYLMSLLYDRDASPEFVRDEHRRLTSDWVCRGERPARRRSRKTLRIGYLTADFFGQHPVAQFLSPLIEAHERAEFSIESFAYDAKPRADATAARMGALFPVRSVEGLGDEAAAAIIRKDDLDLLIDLSGHTSGRRLPVLGLRPASVTACFIGYPSTTGFSGVDWLIGDSALFPAGADALYTERLARLRRPFIAFAPPPGMPPPRTRRPAGPVTFGSLNHYPKINAAVLDVWARILVATPRSRLMIQCAAFAEADSVAMAGAEFESRGVEKNRLRFEPPQPFAQAMRRYHEIDIALDPFPYNGGTTTAHALYMGVPVVALEGAYFCGRMGASLLAAASQPQWLAQDSEQYVAIAVDLGKRIEGGEDIREAILRSNQTAPLFDTAGYARDVAALYREIAG